MRIIIKKAKLLTVFLSLIVSVSIDIPKLKAAPISFNTALPVAKDAFLNREQFVFRRFKNDNSSLDRELRVNGVISVLGIGVTTKWALFGAVPYFDKKLNLIINDQPLTRSNNNIGDIKVFGRYTFLQRDEPSKTLRLAGFAGVKAPTGDNTKIDEFGLLPVPLQSGTGSWDYFAGLVTTYQKLDYQIDAQLSGDYKGQANNFSIGDEYRADVSLQYRISPLKNDTHHFIYAVIEANLIYQDSNEFLNINDRNSGGTILFITPGIQYVTVKYILEAAIQLPVLQNLNGNALETDYNLTTGFRINF